MNQYDNISTTMNYISTIIILTLTFLVYCAVSTHDKNSFTIENKRMERERLEDFCRYYKIQELKENEK